MSQGYAQTSEICLWRLAPVSECFRLLGRWISGNPRSITPGAGSRFGVEASTRRLCVRGVIVSGERRTTPQVICPTGSYTMDVSQPVQPPPQKFSISRFTQIKFIFTLSCLPEGRFAIVTSVRRDAVDVSGAQTKRRLADGEVVWS